MTTYKKKKIIMIMIWRCLLFLFYRSTFIKLEVIRFVLYLLQAAQLYFVITTVYMYSIRSQDEIAALTTKYTHISYSLRSSTRGEMIVVIR